MDKRLVSMHILVIRNIWTQEGLETLTNIYLLFTKPVLNCITINRSRQKYCTQNRNASYIFLSSPYLRCHHGPFLATYLTIIHCFYNFLYKGGSSNLSPILRKNSFLYRTAEDYSTQIYRSSDDFISDPFKLIIMSVSTVAIIENNEMQIQKKIFRITFVSHWCPFSSISCHIILHSSPFAEHTRMFWTVKKIDSWNGWVRLLPTYFFTSVAGGQIGVWNICQELVDSGDTQRTVSSEYSYEVEWKNK